MIRDYFPITGTYTCPILREGTNHAVKLLCGHIFDKKMIELWLQKIKQCPICRRSPEEFYSKMQRCVLVLHSSLKTLMRYGPLATDSVLHFLIPSSLFQRHSCLTASASLNILLVTAPDLVRNNQSNAEERGLTQAVKKIETYSKNLIQLGHISNAISLSFLAADVIDESASRILPFIYVFGVLAIAMGNLALLGTQAIYPKDHLDRDPIRYLITIYIYSISALNTYFLFSPTSEQLESGGR